jgi:hypothetical protein
LLFWAVLAVGLAFTAWGAYMRRRARAAFGWPTTTALVIESRVEEVPGPEGERTYRARVRYRYRVGDDYYYSGDDGAMRPAVGGSYEAAEAATLVRPRGSTLEIRYDPARPGDSMPALGDAEVLDDRGLVVQSAGLAVSGLAILFRLLI